MAYNNKKNLILKKKVFVTQRSSDSKVQCEGNIFRNQKQGKTIASDLVYNFFSF